MQTPREICLKLLISTERNASYSNIALDSTLSKYTQLKDVDRRFISALYYGVIERKITLDAIISRYSQRPLEKLSDAVRQILRMGVYQLLYMDSVPDNAAVNESVILAKENKREAVAGFVNALLRSFIRDGKKLPLTGVKLDDLSIEYSCPKQLIGMWQKDYGDEVMLSMLRSSVGKPPVSVRLNTCKFALDEILASLCSDGVEYRSYNFLPDSMELLHCGSVERLDAYKKGMLHVQDVSCQICAIELGAKSGDKVLDVCSAPGGKAFTIAEIMGDKGEILAFDLHKNRVRLIQQGAGRLGLEIIKASENNAKVYNPKIGEADAVLCDVPCSGLGVIRRKPEIKYSDFEAIKNLPGVQYDILCCSSRYVKKSGVLVYSTCTLNRAENDDIAKRFLSEHQDFEPAKLNNFSDYKTTITPDMFGSDGFFIAKFRRK